MTATQTWNPTPVADGFLAMAADGENLYLVGGSGWEGDPGFVSSTGALLVLPLSDITATPREIGDGIHSYRLIESVAVDAARDGIYVLGNNASGVATLAQACVLDGCELVDAGRDEQTCAQHRAGRDQPGTGSLLPCARPCAGW